MISPVRAEVERAQVFLDRSRDQVSKMQGDQSAVFAALDQQKITLQSGIERAQKQVRRVRDLLAQGYATRDLVDQHERSLFELDRQQIDLRLKRVEYQRQFQEKQREAEAGLADKLSQKVSLENQLHGIDAQIARLKVESELVVEAQTPGFVLAMIGRVGDTVAPGQFVAAIGDPSAETIVVLDAPARAVGLLKVGQQAVLKYDAFPYKTFGVQHGTITAISQSSIRTPDTKDEIGLDPRPIERQSLYRVEVRPDSREIVAYGEVQALKIGSTLTAELIVERRRLIDWVLDPIRAMRGRT